MADGYSDLVIADDDYTSKSAEYMTTATEIGRAYLKYQNILKEILANNLIQGDKAVKLQGFANFARDYLGSGLANNLYISISSGLGDGQSQQMKFYIRDIDNEDSILY